MFILRRHVSLKRDPDLPGPLARLRAHAAFRRSLSQFSSSSLSPHTDAPKCVRGHSDASYEGALEEFPAELLPALLPSGLIPFVSHLVIPLAAVFLSLGESVNLSKGKWYLHLGGF